MTCRGIGGSTKSLARTGWLLALLVAAAGGARAQAEPAATGALAPSVTRKPEKLRGPAFTDIVALAGDYGGKREGQDFTVRILRDGRTGFLVGPQPDSGLTGGGTAELHDGRLTLRWHADPLPVRFEDHEVGPDGELVGVAAVPWASGSRAHASLQGPEQRWHNLRGLVRTLIGQDPPVLLVVPWESWIYLVPESEGEAFCRAVNAGHEPTGRAPEDAWLVSRRGVTRKPRGLPEVPEAWSAWLLPAPVEGRMVSQQPDGSWAVELLRGSEVPEGLTLYTRALRNGLEPKFGTISLQGRVEEATGQRVLVRWNRDDKAVVQSGALVGSLERDNGATFDADLGTDEAQRVEQGRLFDFTDATMLAGTEPQRLHWQVLVLRAFYGTATPGGWGVSEPDVSRAARDELEALDPVALVPSCLAALTGTDFTKEEQVASAAALLSWWDARQHHVYSLGFDGDTSRMTPLAAVERRAAVQRWAEWWEALGRDPAALARYRSDVADAERTAQAAADR